MPTPLSYEVKDIVLYDTQEKLPNGADNPNYGKVIYTYKTTDGPVAPLVVNDSGIRSITSDELMKTVRQHWKMLLLTKPGEAMEDPSFGCGLMSFLFQNSTKDVVKTTNSGVVIYDDPRETIRLTIINQAQKYLGYLTVNDVEVNSIPDSNTLQVSIRYTLDVTGVSDAIDFDLSTVLTGELKSNPSSNAPDYYAQFD